MRGRTRNLSWTFLAVLCATVQLAAQVARPVRTPPALDVQIGPASIGGVVLNSNGDTPEAGVWVIAETKTLPVPFRKIVVTDDKGRFVVPDLPPGSYELWVRGYGLKDSARVSVSRGQRVRMQVANAQHPQEAATIYPPNYWTSLIQLPSKGEIPPNFGSQDQWIAAWKNACNHCHMIGSIATRGVNRIPDYETILKLNRGMDNEARGLGLDPLLKSLADWGARIQAGEVPPAPPRPAGLERNFVVTQWDWGYNDSFFHDVTSTDKRNPTLYAYGKVYGVDMGKGTLWELDPVRNTVTPRLIPVRKQQGYNAKFDYYHETATPDNWIAVPHNPMLDEKGRVWMTAQVRPESPDDYPKWARSAISTETDSEAEIDQAHQVLSTSRQHGQLGFFDTRAGKFVQVDTIFGTHHLQFDWQGRLWANSPGGTTALGMFDPNKLNPDDPQGTEARAQEAWVRIDPQTGKNMPGSGYATTVNPRDGTIWQSDPASGGPLNKLYKFDPKTGKFTDYPLTPPGRLPHGIDFSSHGKVWFSTGSGHLGRFDPANEKFTYWTLPGPKFKGTGDETGSTEYPYFLWVDQFDVLGLGKDTVIVTGTTSDSLLLFDPQKETFSVVRVPYPLPFYTRGLDGRIDDPKAGWKGRGLWATYSSYMPRFTETRSGYVTHIQLRPHPLAN